MNIMSIVGGPQSVAGANGGKTYAFNNINATTNVQVADIRPNRRSITFINPGSNVTIYVSMLQQLTPLGTPQVGSPLTPTNAALGGAMPVFPGAFVRIEGECQSAWQALAASGTTNPLTVMDSFA